MTRVERKFSEREFNQCQICGYTENEITSFRIWEECDDQDKPIPGSYLFTCKDKKCLKVIQDSETLYREVPWGTCSPGALILLCGPCTYRKAFECQHPHLKKNGGKGLLIHLANDAYHSALICYYDEETGEHHCRNPHRPAIGCEGLPEDNSRSAKPDSTKPEIDIPDGRTP